MARNEEVYPEPEVFNPDRFLHPSSQQAHEHVEAVWGFGRRACPGRVFAEASLWLCMANFIATMDIEKAVDGDGIPMTPAAAFMPGAIR
jgi:cytochrome P450